MVIIAKVTMPFSPAKILCPKKRKRVIRFYSVIDNCKFLLVVTAVFLQSCTVQHQDILTPTGISPFLYDDSDYSSLKVALQQQLHYLQKQDKDISFTIVDRTIDKKLLIESLKSLIEIVGRNPSPFTFDKIIKEKFSVYQAGGRDNFPAGTMLVTGYYEPVLQGNLKKTDPYVFPLYSPPADLMVHISDSGEKKFGKYDSFGRFQPYWDREKIENSDILQGNELVYLKDPFDAFLLHIQGSGRIQLPDGTTKTIQYRANNGHNYSSIGKLLVEEKKLVLGQVDIPEIRNYLDSHPEDFQRILNHNRRYIFFGWGKDDHVRGSIGVPLTPGRSIAIDGMRLPLGSIGYLLSRRPVINDNGKIIKWRPLHRFVLPQDTGSAIKGSGRVDIFWGKTKYAEKAAGAMKEKGKLYFLIKKWKQKQ